MGADAGKGHKLVGKCLRKAFQDSWFHGTILSYDANAKCYKARYVDDDCEDLELADVQALLLPPFQRHLTSSQLLVQPYKAAA